MNLIKNLTDDETKKKKTRKKVTVGQGFRDLHEEYIPLILNTFPNGVIANLNNIIFEN